MLFYITLDLFDGDTLRRFTAHLLHYVTLRCAIMLHRFTLDMDFLS